MIREKLLLRRLKRRSYRGLRFRRIRPVSNCIRVEPRWRMPLGLFVHGHVVVQRVVDGICSGLWRVLE